MASFKELKNKYRLLHRFMCGLAVTCLFVSIVGCAFYGDMNWTKQWTNCLPLGFGGLTDALFPGDFHLCYEMSITTIILSWSLIVLIGVMTVEYFVLKMWAAWENVHEGAGKDEW